MKDLVEASFRLGIKTFRVWAKEQLGLSKKF